MADIATLQSQLDALKKARASGTQRVAIANGIDVTYKSDAEMAEAIGALESEIARLSGSDPPRNIVIRSRKGW
jgi:hypothetical protein